jgi:hypothetical protein
MGWLDWCLACSAYTPHQGVEDRSQPRQGAIGGVCLRCGYAHDAR